MLTIILKIILSSSILLGIYYLLLAKEKTFRFNRFYLLLALIVSYVIPFVKIKLPAVSQHKNQLIFDEIKTKSVIKQSEISSFDWTNVLITTYVLICIILIIRLIISLKKIISLQGTDILYQNQKVRLIDANLPPLSFWNTIYINEKYYNEQKIDARIFLHEKTHIQQKHTLDIIFLEILTVISWCNPILYFYKKAIIDNHEFLADDCIIQQKNNVKDYQKLILSEIILNQKLNLAHQFNYNNTKKRFIMMNTKKSKFETLKNIVAVCAITGLSSLFVQKIYAQNTTKKDYTLTRISEKDYTASDKKILEMYKEDLKKTKIPIDKDSAERLVMDTIPANKKLKENELPIPPPPPPARIFKNAEFPEGLNALRTNFQNTFDSSKFDKKDGTLKTSVFISIDENGKTKEVRAVGPNKKFNEEAVRSIKLVTENKVWKPATDDDKPAATVFQFPITMAFQ